MQTGVENNWQSYTWKSISNTHQTTCVCLKLILFHIVPNKTSSRSRPRRMKRQYFTEKKTKIKKPFTKLNDSNVKHSKTMTENITATLMKIHKTS